MRRLDPRHAGWLLLALLAVAAAVQASRLPMRWSPVALAYGAYVAEWRHAVRVDGGWLTTWQGLHPPLYAWLLSAMLKLGVPPLGWLALSGLASVAAVPLTVATVYAARGRAGLVAALVAGAFVALSPHRVAYGLEVNNYPLLVGALALQALAFARWSKGGSGIPLTLTSAALPWVHVLGATAVLGQALAVATVDRGRLVAFGKALAPALLLWAPLAIGLGEAVGDPINEAAGLGAALTSLTADLPGRYGLAAAGWGAAILAGVGAREAWRGEDRLVPVSWIGAAAVGAAAVLAALTSAQASSLQLQYWLVPLGPVLCLAGLAIQGREQRQAWVLVLCLLLGANALTLGLDAVDARWQRSRAVHYHPRVQATIGAWAPGEVLLLVGLPFYGDDDKDAVDAAWSGVPSTIALDYRDPGVPGLTPADPYWGIPVRFVDGRWLYTFTSANVRRLEAVADAHTAGGARVHVGAYGLAAHPTARRDLGAWAKERGWAAAGSSDELSWTISPSGRPGQDAATSPPR